MFETCGGGDQNLSGKMRAVVMGGGIKGAALAGWLSMSGKAEVVLLTRDKLGYGASVTNHGRIHCGTNTWRTDLGDPLHEAITLPRAHAAKYLQTIPGVCEFVDWGLQLIPEASEVERFERFCESLEIPCREARLGHSDRCWVDEHSAAAIFEVPEYAFKPAELAGRLAALAEKFGAQIRTGSAVTSVKRVSGHWTVTTSAGDTYEADLVFNAMGVWAGQVVPEGVPPLSSPEDYRFDSWPLVYLACESARVRPLTRTLTILDSEEVKATAIPHGGSIIIGCNTGTLPLDDPDDPRGRERRAFRSEGMELEILMQCALWFTPVRSIRQKRLYEVLETFFGMLRRPQAAETGSAAWHGVFNDRSVEGYFELSGGIATTAILDTLGVAVRALDLSQEEEAYMKDALPSHIPRKERADTAEMSWESRAAADGIMSGKPARKIFVPRILPVLSPC